MKKNICFLLTVMFILNFFTSAALADTSINNTVANDVIQTYKENNQVDENFGNVYKKEKTVLGNDSVLSNVSIDQNVNKDYVQSYEASLDTEHLVKQTADKYEVVAAKSDGSYLFLDSSNNYGDSVNIAQKFNQVFNGNNTTVNQEYISSIVDSYGNIIFSTDGMARAIKYTNGKVDNSQVTNLFDNSSGVGGTNPQGYINHNYIEDAPIIDMTDNAVKVMINGYKGWAKRDTSDGTYDFTIVPMNQVTNPSYYIVKNNQLNHYISSDMTDTSGTKGYTISIGVAPSYLTSGTKYYSYDGKYFYTTLNTLISDLRTNITSNAVNSNSPFYNYYQYLPFRSKTSYTADQLNNFINVNTTTTSKLRGVGQALIDAQNKYGVNAGIILGVAINESAWGNSTIAQTKNNIFGIAAYDNDPLGSSAPFSTVESCIERFARDYISKGYADPQDWRYFGEFLGNKELGANVEYASDPFWGEKNAAHFFNIDKSISGFNTNGYKYSTLLDYNRYLLGIYNGNTSVKFSNNTIIYNVANKTTACSDVVNGTTIINSYAPVNINGVDSYKVTPARSTSIANSSDEFSGDFDWSAEGYIDKSKVTIINDYQNYDSDIQYETHVQDIGWQNWVNSGDISGTVGQSKRVEAFSIRVNNRKYPDAKLTYRAHVQDIGWQNWVNNGEIAGTEGQSKRVEALQISVQGLPDNVELQYRVHVQDIGWQAWRRSGEVAGTTGEAKRIEAIQIRIVAKQPSIQYKAHVQNVGWQNWVYDGNIAGTEGQSLRVEAFSAKMVDFPGVKLSYRAHVQNIGWQNLVYNGNIAGTEGKGLRVEALQITADGLPEDCKLEYRAHVQNIGWQDWKSSGQIAGTVGQSLRVEAIELRIVKK